jgi:hypothetical protein
MIDRAGALWATRWPRPTVAGLAILATWIGGVFLATGGIRMLVKRLGITKSGELPSPVQALPD